MAVIIHRPKIVSVCIFAALFCMLTYGGLGAQEKQIQLKYTYTVMDSSFDVAPPTKVTKIMQRYRPLMENKMMAVVGYAPKALESDRPESLLSNFAADALLYVARGQENGNIDFALTNFGGLRASIPQGDVRLYDIYAVFPFENALVILDMEGTDVWKLFEAFAVRGRVEAVSGISIKIEKRKIKELLIGGKPFDPQKRYRVATIDFLLGGGDSVAALKNAVSVEYTGLMLRDVVLKYIEMRKAEGKDVGAEVGGRVSIQEEQQ
jgi:5''-nucleotidase/2'',3''-cyclic phosphodiesterase and related esterases